LCDAVSHFADGEPQEDDMTIVLARRNANHAA
jgi:serine phosphatase RsbU (regulator of sigma subunit)